MSTRTGNAVQQYLNHLASLRADASSPATTLRLDDYLDKFPTIEEHAVSRHPSQRQDSPVLGYRPSLDNTTSPTSTTTITSDTQNHFQSTGLIAGLSPFQPSDSRLSPSHTSSLSPSTPERFAERPRAPTPSSATPDEAPDAQFLLQQQEHQEAQDQAQFNLPRSYSARELPAALGISDNSSPMLLRSVSDASPRTRNRVPSPSPPMPHRSTVHHTTNTNINTKYSIYAPPTLVATGEALSTPPLPDLPDPSLYPDPYPSYQPRPRNGGSAHNMTPPISLFSEGSSSASTRSSLAFNNSSSSPYSGMRMSDPYDNGSDDHHSHRRAAHSSGPFTSEAYDDVEAEGAVIDDRDMSGDMLDRPNDVGVALTSDEPSHLAHSSSLSSFVSVNGSTGSRAATTGVPIARVPISNSNTDAATRWSGSSYGRTGAAPNEGSGLKNQASYDWDIVDEREEYGITTDEETDDNDDEDDEDDAEADGDDIEADRTAAIVLAEEGKGTIVRGEGISVDRLVLRPGTTHLLLSSSSTPNQMPSFLATALMNIPGTLLALDISYNLLPALPPALASCSVLEELNITANPLRVLPSWLANLKSLRVLIADSTSITTVPQQLYALTSLHTLSLRRNRLYSLPSWLCHLTSLETLLVEGNPFIEPWVSLVAPLLPSEEPKSPAYPPNTPQPAATSAFVTDTYTPSPSNNPNQPTEFSAMQGSPSPSGAGLEASRQPQESNLRRSISSPHRRPNLNSTYSTNESQSRPPSSAQASSSKFQAQLAEYPSARPRAGPSTSTVRPPAAATASLVGSYLNSLDPDEALPIDSELDFQSQPLRSAPLGNGNPRMVRRMKSADELTRLSTPKVPVQQLDDDSDRGEASLPMRRFESLGRGQAARTAARQHVSMWADSPTSKGRPDSTAEAVTRARMPSRSVYVEPPKSPEREREREREPEREREYVEPKSATEKTKKWGFLKKMSMGRMRSGSSAAKDFQPPPLPQRIVPTRSTSSVDPPTLSPPRLLRPDHVHASSAPIVPRISEDNITPPSLPWSRQPPSLPQFSPITPLQHPAMGLPMLDSPMLPQQQQQDEEPDTPPPPPPKTQMQRKASREAMASMLAPPKFAVSPPSPNTAAATASRINKRRSFLPLNLNMSHSALEIPIPSPGPFMRDTVAVDRSDEALDMADDSAQYIVAHDPQQEQRDLEEAHRRETYSRALRSVMAYLRDLSDLSGPMIPEAPLNSPTSSSNPGSPSADDARRRRPTLESGSASRVFSEGSFASISSQPSSISGQLRKKASTVSLATGALSVTTTDSGGSGGNTEERKYKEDKKKRAMIVKEIVVTERTYVAQLQELVDIYVNPSNAPVINKFTNQASKETILPQAERRIVFNGIESLLQFHKESFLPSLEKAIAPLEEHPSDIGGDISASVASQLAMVFVSHAAFMRMYSTYINNFDNCVARIRTWADKPSGSGSGAVTPAAGAANVIGLGLTMSVVAALAPEAAQPSNLAMLNSSQKKRVKKFLDKSRLNPRHSQLNLEGYLLLPVQRIPRYRLLLEDLARCTPPRSTAFDDPLEVATKEVSSLAQNMNEEKRDSESRAKLVAWQQKIRGKFPSPLVQPHRRLIMDGRMRLSRVVRKSATYAQVIKPDGEKSLVQVECLSPELTPRPLLALLCNDMLVLCKDPSHGSDPNACYDLWAVLRMQTTGQPASVVHGNTLRLVDNKAILYFEAPSTSDALTWSRAINLEIPGSR